MHGRIGTGRQARLYAGSRWQSFSWRLAVTRPSALLLTITDTAAKMNDLGFGFRPSLTRESVINTCTASDSTYTYAAKARPNKSVFVF